jgi:hypothetical protein
MHAAGDAGGHRIVFDAGQVAGAAQRRRQQGEEQASAHAGFEHTPAVKAEMLGRAPEGADDRLGGVVGILGRPLQGRVFGRRDRFRELLADVFPAGPEPGRTRQRKAGLGQFGRTEAGEAEQLRLFLGGGRAPGRFQMSSSLCWSR